MSNTVITNYTDLNGPSTKADSSVVVIVNKDGSLSVDQNLLGTLMGTDGTQASGISVVRVGHEGRPDDATDSETEDDKVPHVTLSVDSYYDEPNSIIKYDSGAEMLQSLRIETRENSLIGFHNDHCYTTLTSPSESQPQSNDNFTGYDEPQIEISHTPPPKPVPSSKKITILEQQIIQKGKKILINPTEAPIILKGNDVLNKPLSVLSKVKKPVESEKSSSTQKKLEESGESSSSISSSGDSIPDRDSDSDYKDTTDRAGSLKVKKSKIKPRILKSSHTPKQTKEPKVISKLKANKTLLKRDLKEKVQLKITSEKQSKPPEVDLESLIPTSEISVPVPAPATDVKTTPKQTPKLARKEKKTPAHVTALLSDMTSLFSTPDVIRRVSTDNKGPAKPEKEISPTETKKFIAIAPKAEGNDAKILEIKPTENVEKPKPQLIHKTYIKQRDKIINPTEKVKGYELIPQLDDASLAQILQDTTSVASNPVKVQPSISTSNTINSPGLAGPLSPTLDLLGGLQPEEEGLTEDLLMHVAQLVESSENLQEVIDKQVLGKVDTAPAKVAIQSPFQQAQAAGNVFAQTTPKPVKNIVIRKDPIEIVRRDGRIITLPPIEAPATRSSKRKSQMETSSNADALSTPVPAPAPVALTPDPPVAQVSKQYVNKKLTTKKPEPIVQQQKPPTPVVDKISAESQESWNSEDDPYRLWCICRQPHNNRFMICCDSCEDWFHGKCVNITKAMGQQMEEQGIEWRCPNCIKKNKPPPKTPVKVLTQKKIELESISTTPSNVIKEKEFPTKEKHLSSKTGCIVCKKPARASSIYCSDACILKHAQDSLGNQPPTGKPDSSQSKAQDKKSESRVIVYERKSGRLLAGPNAPTAENLKAWLQKNPTFEVVRPGTLSTIKPNVNKKKSLTSSTESNKIQTTLNFERMPKKTDQQTPAKAHQPDAKDRTPKVLPSSREEKPMKITPSPREEKLSRLLLSPKEEMKAMPKTPVTPKTQPAHIIETPKASTSFAKTSSEPRKLVRATSRSSHDKAPSVSPSTSRRKDTHSAKKMDSTEPIRENVRKALQEQMTMRMAEHDGPRFTEQEIQQFAYDTEDELHELFSRDVGMKYKAKYRSLMFNIKDRKNLSLWQKICDRTITPKQLVRLSPEELASQELAEWRDQEAKHQLELIKKSEIDLLAASKTYVLKTHKGEEVMETKESVCEELDPNVPVEDLVTALNDQTVGEVPPPEEIVPGTPSVIKENTEKKHGSSKKRGRGDSSSSHKKSKKESKRDSDRRKSKSSRRESEKEKESRDEKSTRKSRRRSSRTKSVSKEASSSEVKEKSDCSERSRRRSRSRTKSKKRSKSRERSRSASNVRDGSHSRKRSTSRDSTKRRRRSRSKHSSSTEDKVKHRSRSQDLSTKTKNDSTDSDSVERPKSAMLKEAHPEYDPHEPMITSAFSEEDLRKSREDVFEDSYKNDIDDYGSTEYDSAKAFSLNTSIIMPTPTAAKHDRISVEAESDQEPSSTVEHSSAIIWNGCINMVDVARFYVAAHEVSGSASDLEDDISTELDIVGRINPDTVWDYIGKMKRASNKDIVVLKLQAANDEEKMQYIALYSYLSSRNRLGVVKVSNTTSVKDFYIVPLPANTTLPPVLLPFDGPGLGEVKTHLLIAIVIRQRKKRMAAHIPKDIIPAKVGRESRKRSYTPPVGGKSSYTPPTSPKRRPLPTLPLPSYTSPALSTSVKDKIAASLACADDEEAYSPGSSSSGGTVPPSTPANPPGNTLRCKMLELNRQIEEQKQQILKMAQADSSVGGDEAYSPSRPMTPPAVMPLADISLPSNLQEILATIKQRSETATADVDMRTLPLPP